MSLVEITFIKVGKIVVNNPKALGILVGAVLVLAGASMPNFWVGLAGGVALLVSVLASLPRDVRRWVMNGLGKAAKDVWDS